MDDDRYRSVSSLLFKEAQLLDERRWDEWRELYTPDAEFWVPAWDSDGELTSDPNNELSLIYYNSRAGLEDRIFRLKTGKSSASNPMPRTCHSVSNIQPSFNEDGSCDVRCVWDVSVYRFGQTYRYYGFYELGLVRSANGWLIRKKKIVLLNDTISTVVDFYMV
jgi:3-phenylpropionate/cinnamic acid dioxygenase small subunit